MSSADLAMRPHLLRVIPPMSRRSLKGLEVDQKESDENPREEQVPRPPNVVEHHIVVQPLNFRYPVRDCLREGRRNLSVVLPQTEHLVEVSPVDSEVKSLELLSVQMSGTIPLTSTVEDAVEHAYY